MTSMVDEIAAIANMIEKSQYHNATRIEMGARLMERLRTAYPPAEPRQGLFVPKLPPATGVPVVINLDLSAQEWQLVSNDGTVLESGEVGL